MTVRTSADIHFDEGDVSHRWHPADDNCEAYGVLKFKFLANLYFGAPGQIDEVIAELAALRAEMTGDDEYRLAPKGEAVAGAEARCSDCDYPLDGSETACISAGCPGRAAAPAQDETPSAAVLPHCGARWPNRGLAGGQWICTLDKGHDGDHEAGTPADGRPYYSSTPQDDDEVTWDETPASVTA